MTVSAHRFCVAPMMQCTDTYDRYLMRLMTSKAFLYTEMVTANSIIHGQCYKKLKFNHEIESPVALQLGGSNINHLKECSKIAEDYGYDEINLNLGCPSDRVIKGEFGASLMLNKELVADCLEVMTNTVKTPITIKCRTGIGNNENYEFLYSFIEYIKDTGIKTIIVHARNAILNGLSPRQNRSIPKLKYNFVYQLKKDFKDLEIIINGGIRTLKDAETHLNKVDGVMLGREAYDNPLILQEVDNKFFGFHSKKRTSKEILDLYLKYIQVNKDKSVIKRALKHIYGLNKGKSGAKEYRQTINDLMMLGDLKEASHKLSKFL
tara:strand:+ start:5165 stop:6127 length:963 start_codon:yes stop_codon:yes gene_type:complete